ncbi:MAG: amino acid permease [Planctomycetota bacterium]
MADRTAPPAVEIPTGLARELRLFDLTMMGVGMMIGAGAVLGMGDSIRLAGPGGTMVAFALNGVLALLTALAYAEMSSAIPRAGSIYNFSRIAFGRPTGFLAGWIAWLASAVAGSLYAALCGIYVVHYLGQLGLLAWVPIATLYQERVTAILIAALFVYINYRGVSETGRAQSLLTLGQTIALAFIAVVGAVVAVREPERLLNFRPFLPHGWTAVIVCMGFEFVAFEGYEVIATAGDEAIDPRRNLPRAILYSVFIVIAMYLVVAFALIAGVRDVGMPVWEWLGKQGPRGFGEAMTKLMPFGGLVATITVIFSATSALNATIYSATRASYALGRDGMLPTFLGKVSKRRRTPHVALCFTAAAVLAAAAFLPIMDVASCSSILFLFMFLLANLCVIRLRREMGSELVYGFRMPLLPALPIVAIAAQLVLAVYIVNVSWIAWVIAPAWIGAGGAVYLLYARRHALPIREEILTVEEAPAPKAEGYRILMPVANPENAVRMVTPVVRLAQAERASVELLHMITMPDQVPLSDAHLYAMEGREAIMEAMLYLSARFPVNTSIRYCRNAARGILAEARQRKANLIVLGAPGKRSARESIFGSTVDPVLDRAPCDVAVLRGCGEAPYKRVLVPLTGGRSDVLALRVASALTDADEGKIEVLQMASPGKTPFNLGAFLEEAAKQIHGSARILRPRHIVTRNAVRTVAEAAQEKDLIVVAAAEGATWRERRARGLAERIASATDKPIVMVRAGGGIRRLLDRWF